MSMAIWAEYLRTDGEIVSDEYDKYQILEYMEALDYLCEEMGIPPLSSLMDYSSTSENFEDELDEETLMRLSEEDEYWNTPREAMAILDALLSNLSENSEQLNAQPHHVQELLEEFEQCINFIQDALDEESEAFRLQLVG